MEKQNSEVSAYIHVAECLSSGNNEVAVLLNYFSLFLEFLECFQPYILWGIPSSLKRQVKWNLNGQKILPCSSEKS